MLKMKVKANRGEADPSTIKKVADIAKQLNLSLKESNNCLQQIIGIETWIRTK